MGYLVETILLLAIVIGTAAVFVWLRRRLGDEWPPAEPVAAGPAVEATTIAPGSETAAVAPIHPAVVDAARSLGATWWEEEAEATAEVIVASRAELERSEVVAATRPAAATPVAPAAPPVYSPTLPWVFAVGGGLLLLLAQWVGRSLPEGQRLPSFLLSLAGGLLLLGGAQIFVRGALPDRLGRGLGRLAAFLRVTPTQVVLLALALCFAWLTRLAAGDGLLARQAAVAVLAWLLAIGLAVAGSVSRPTTRAAGTSPWPAIDRWDVLLMLGLFVLALALRATAMTRFPNTYSGDEGSSGLFAVELLTGKANNLFSLGWFSFPALYFTVQSAAIALLGQTVEAVRLTSALAGALTVVALYALGRAMFDRTTAVLAALYLAVSHYHIHMSRIALNNVWDGLFGTAAILGLWYGWRSGRRIGFIVCGLALGLGQYFYVTIRLLPILFLIWAAVAFWRQRALFRERLAGLVLAAFIALVVFLPLGLYFAAHPDEFQAPMNRVTIFGSDWLEGQLAQGDRTTADVIRDQAISGALGFTHEPLKLLYNPGSALLLTGAGVFFLLGVLWALLNFDLRYLLLFLPLLAVIASNAVSQDSPASQRYVLAMPLVSLFVALPLGQAAAWLRAHYPRARAAIAVAALVVMAVIAAVDINYYFNRVYDTYVLGGINTTAATEIAYFLRDKEPAGQEVYFFGFPRMGYFSLSTIPFLAPDKVGLDVIEPLTGPADFPLRGPTLFIFLPERLSELEFVRQRYPGGAYQEFIGADGGLLYAVYETAG
jgi:4-amino-4-deoxy-L-arabinose transferase-like glycosyltransferase